MAMTEVGQATVTIIPNMKGAQEKISKDLGAVGGGAGEKAGKLFGGKIIGTLGKLGVAAAIGSIIKDSIGEGAKLQQSLGGIETLFKENADTVKGYASQAYKTAGMSANEYMENVTSFSAALIKSMDGDTAAAAEMANTAMIDMADNANKMGTDMSSIQTAYQGFAKQNYTMLDNLKLGYGGTKEEMSRLLADATKLSGVEYNIDNLSDVYEAIHVIQEDLGITGTTAKEAASTFEGSLSSMKAAWTDLQGNMALGNDIGPQVEALGETINTFITGNLLPMIGNVVSQLPTLLASVPGMVADLLPGLLDGVVDIVSGLASGVVDNIPVFVEGIGELLAAAWDALVNFDWTGAAQAGVDLLTAAWEGLIDIASDIWDSVIGFFTQDITFADIATAAESVWNGLTSTAETIWNTVTGFFTSVIDFPSLDEAAQTAWGTLESIASNVWGLVTGVFGGVVDFISQDDLAQTAWSTLEGIASGVWDAVKAVFKGAVEFLSLDTLAETAWSTLEGVASGVWDLVKGVFGASDVAFVDLSGVAADMWNKLKSVADNVWGKIKGALEKSDVVFADLSSAASTAWATLTSTAGDIWDGIKEVFGSFEITWPDFGALAKGAFDKLKETAQGVWDWIKGLFGGGDEASDEAMQSITGTTDEMAKAFADVKLKVAEVDMSQIILANKHVTDAVAMWKRVIGQSEYKLGHISTSALTAAKKAVISAASVYKSTMNFSWSLPDLHGKLPVITANMRTATSSDGKTSISYPSLDIGGYRWFAQGGIFNSPTVIGIGDSKGPEAAVPLDMMWRQMSKEFDKHLNGGAQVINNFTVDGAQDPEAWAMGAARTLQRELRMA